MFFNFSSGLHPCSKLQCNSAQCSSRSDKVCSKLTSRRKQTPTSQAAPRNGAEAASSALSVTRRLVLSLGITPFIGSAAANELVTSFERENTSKQKAGPSVVDYSRQGPFQPVRLPRLEHICSECFPRCLGDQCLLRIDVTYPKGVGNIGYDGPYPLAIFTSGYLVGCDAYQSYADRLASWGYTVVLYDKIESVADTLNDEVSARMITDIIDWCQVSRLMKQIADTSRVYLVGHSRGGKISSLAAVSDPRIAAMCLIDPVDTTVYAPLAPGFPSAVSALQQLPPDRSLPIAVVGSGIAGDCVPKYSNYSRFFESVRSPAWEVVIQDSGHFSFLDRQSALQRAICPQGNVSEQDVRNVSQTIMVAWAEAMVRQGADSDGSCPDCTPQSQPSDGMNPSTASVTVDAVSHTNDGNSTRVSDRMNPSSSNSTKSTTNTRAHTGDEHSAGTTQGSGTQASLLSAGSSSHSRSRTVSTSGTLGNDGGSGVGTVSTSGAVASSDWLSIPGAGSSRDNNIIGNERIWEQDRNSWGSGCLAVEIDRRPLVANRNENVEQAPHESAASASTTIGVARISHTASSSTIISNAAISNAGVSDGRQSEILRKPSQSTAESGSRGGMRESSTTVEGEVGTSGSGRAAVNEWSESVMGDRSGRPRVNTLSDWSEFGLNKMRDVNWERYRFFTSEPATTRKELEGILTRLQYQTLLSLSSRYRNF